MANEKPEIQENELKTKAHLQAYDLLKTSAAWLDNPDNELFGLLEFDDNSLSIAVKAAVLASACLKKAALDIQLISGIEDTNKYGKTVIDAMNDLTALANEFDESGDENLIKRASVLDEILITMASGVEQQEILKQNFDKKIAEIKERSKKMNDPSFQKKIATEPAAPQKKEYRPLEAPLSTRYCPDHPGASLARIRDNVWYCLYDSKQYDFSAGYTTMKGNKVPPSSVENQTADLENVSFPVIFGDKTK